MSDPSKSQSTPDVLAELRAPDWRGPMQHLRSWSDLDRLHDAAAAEIERLRRIAEEAEFVCQNDMAGIVEDDAWERLRAALGIGCAP